VNGLTQVNINDRWYKATDTVMIDATHLKAHRTAASLLKKGLYPAVLDVRKVV
jgi:hypothetical protein